MSRASKRRLYDPETAREKNARYQQVRPRRVLDAEGKKRHAARQRLLRAVKAGRVKRPEACERCGVDTSVQAHHHDYDKPFDVRWLCSRCHGVEHREE